MPRCSASSCRNMGSHTFPKDPHLRKLWEEATNKDNFKASKHSRLCSDHFKLSDYVDVCLSTGMSPFHRYLKKTAVPSIFGGRNQQSTEKGASDIETRTASPTTKNNVVKKNPVSPKAKPKEQEKNTAEINNSPRNRSVRLRNRKAFLLNRRCSVPHCNIRPTNEVSLHPCPNNAAVRNEWAEALRVSYQYVKNMVACSLHFTKIDFIQSKSSERVLKHNAVPSRNLQIRKKVMVPVKHKLIKKETSKAFERQKTMTDTVCETKESEKEEQVRECRACLKKLDHRTSSCNVFQAWAPPWDGMEATIAEDLAKLANVEISLTDRHSKVICAPCYQQLLDAATFVSTVRNCDLLLRMRFTAEIDMEKVWPKPIQVDKNINGDVFNNAMDVEIKQEVLSDDEYPVNRSDNPYVEGELANLDIKIEPEELVEPPPMNITINGTISLDPLNSENKDLKNGTDLRQETHFIQMEVKQEPTSEGEQEIEPTPDLPLECLLCTKSFNSVTGLKAHVIAQHSYKTVKRKSDGSVASEKKRTDLHQCAICKRNFQTSTDLMVHETCHNKHVCYGCTEKFDSFDLLTRHRKRCKASIANSVQKLKTLDDVKRPVLEGKVDFLEIEKVESVSKPIQDEDVDMKESEIKNTEKEYTVMKESVTINNDMEMKELDNESKEENSKEDNLGHVTENVETDNKIESVMKELDNDKNSGSEIEPKENNEQLEIIIQEVSSVMKETDDDKKLESEVDENDKQSERVREEVDSDNEIENLMKEIHDDKRLETETGANENDRQLEEAIKEVDSDKNIESVIEELDSEKPETVINDIESDVQKPESDKEVETEHQETESNEDPDSNMKLHLEILSTNAKTDSRISDADMPIETLDNDDCT